MQPDIHLTALCTVFRNYLHAPVLKFVERIKTKVHREHKQKLQSAKNAQAGLSEPTVLSSESHV